MLAEGGVDEAPHGHPFGGRVRKLKWSDDNGSTWRFVYVREYEEALYVINAYQKKSKSGSKEPQENLNTTKVRLRWAEDQHAARLAKEAAEEKAKQGGQGPKRRGGK